MGMKCLGESTSFPAISFSYNDYKWFWIPLISPFIGGACIATGLYKLLISPFLPELEDDKKSIKSEDSDEDQYVPTEVVIEKLKIKELGA